MVEIAKKRNCNCIVVFSCVDEKSQQTETFQYTDHYQQEFKVDFKKSLFLPYSISLVHSKL